MANPSDAPVVDGEGAAFAVVPLAPVALVPLLATGALEDNRGDMMGELHVPVVAHDLAVARHRVQDRLHILFGQDVEVPIRVRVVPDQGPTDAVAVAVDAPPFAHWRRP